MFIRVGNSYGNFYLFLLFKPDQTEYNGWILSNGKNKRKSLALHSSLFLNDDKNHRHNNNNNSYHYWFVEAI